MSDKVAEIVTEQQWEPVHGNVTRFKVPGGWLYAVVHQNERHVFDTNGGIEYFYESTVTFVPERKQSFLFLGPR